MGRRDNRYPRLDALEEEFLHALKREFKKELQGELSFFLYSLRNHKKYPHEHHRIHDPHLDKRMKDILEIRRSLRDEGSQKEVLAVVDEYVKRMVEGNFLRNRTFCQQAVKKLDEILART